jgi:tetratricopeptide (TPR) repeat protein
MVAFQENGMTMIMDWDTFDYTYGDANMPDPAQRDLDAVLPQVTRVCVLDGAMFRGRAMGGRVLLDLDDAGAIQDLADCLQIVEDPNTFGHCACLGGPTMELYSGPEHLATIGLQHGRAIRWKKWLHDAQLRTGDRLTRWLHDRGVEPRQLEAIYQRGNNFLAAGASSRSQNEAMQLGSQAVERAQKGDLTAAVELCTRALSLDPDQMGVYALRGQLHFHLGRLPEAAADCSAAIERGFRSSEIYFIRAVVRDGEGRTKEALADCSMALHLDPEHAAAYNSRGFIRNRLGLADEALLDFTEACRLAPNWALPYLNRAGLHHERSEIDASLSDYDRAIELLTRATPARAGEDADSSLAQAFLRRGEARRDAFRDEEAEADFDEAQRRRPAAAAEYLGEMWLRRNEFDRALEAFSRLVALRPQDAIGYRGCGMARMAQGDLERAAADFSTAIRLEPDAGSTFFLRAQIRLRQERAGEALADNSEHLRLNPSDAKAFLFRASLHKQRNAPAAALEDLNAAHHAAPDNPQVCNNLAWALATCSDSRLRDGARAVALARQACEATDWKHPFCLGTLGAALAETGAFSEAIKWQTQALEQYPDEEIPAGRTRLERYRAGQPHRE